MAEVAPPSISLTECDDRDAITVLRSGPTDVLVVPLPSPVRTAFRAVRAELIFPTDEDPGALDAATVGDSS